MKWKLDIDLGQVFLIVVAMLAMWKGQDSTAIMLMMFAVMGELARIRCAIQDVKDSDNG